MTNRNPLGGLNPNSLYAPMSETEQEFLDHLRSRGDLRVTIHGWGFLDNPPFQLGDHRVAIPIDITFVAPEVPIPVHSFDLELSVGPCGSLGGVTLFRETQSCLYNGQPMLIGAATHLQMAWDIAIRAIDPNLIRTFLPGVTGLTSRAFDKDTGALTDLGNTHFDAKTRHLLATLRKQEAKVREQSKVPRGK